MPTIKEKVILCGGDRRELELYRCWRNQGIDVKAAGFDEIPEMEKATETDFGEAGVLIAPPAGIDADGTVRTPFSGEVLNLKKYLDRRTRGVILLAGKVAAPLGEALARRNVLILTGHDEELALLNAIPTAEGAIQKAMELSTVTVHGSSALIFGLGRCGGALGRALQGLGARVTAVVRRSESAARAYAAGLASCDPASAAEAAARADFIFNTVPAPVLTAPLLKRVKTGTVILDLAASPGGTDFAAAAGFGLEAVLLPGLPGRAAPQTAGRILERVYRRLIAEAGGTKNT